MRTRCLSSNLPRSVAPYVALLLVGIEATACGNSPAGSNATPPSVPASVEVTSTAPARSTARPSLEEASVEVTAGANRTLHPKGSGNTPNSPARSNGTPSFEAASVEVTAGANCTLHAAGSGNASASLAIRADDDGVARFLAPRRTATNGIENLQLDCIDGSGGSRTYPIDLASDAAFASRPFDPERANLELRPALVGDPLLLTQEELLRDGYGLRPDPTQNPAGYETWLEHARTPAYKLGTAMKGAPAAAQSARRRAAAPVPQSGAPAASAAVTPMAINYEPGGGGYWTGAQLQGSYIQGSFLGKPSLALSSVYIESVGTFAIPAIASSTRSTNASIWVALSGGADYDPAYLGSDTCGDATTGRCTLFQSGVGVDSVPGVAAKWRLVNQNFLNNSAADGGAVANAEVNAVRAAEAKFSPNPGDKITAEVWYCNAKGAPSLTGGYGCFEIWDTPVGGGQAVVLDCLPNSSGCPAWPLLADMETLGTVAKDAEFIIEDDTWETYGTSYYQWPNFEGALQMTASSVLLTPGGQKTVYPGTDPDTQVIEDFATGMPVPASVTIPSSQVVQWDWRTAPAVFVRSTGEVDVVAQAPDYSLVYYHASGSPLAWSPPSVVAPANSAFSAPAIFVDSSGKASLAVQGPNHSLTYYSATPGAAWTSSTVAGAGTTYSAPSIFVRSINPVGEIDVVAQGPSNSLMYYHAAARGSWGGGAIAGANTTYSAPSIFVRSTAPAGEADVVAQGPNNSLMFYNALPGGAWGINTIGAANTTYSAPSIFVRSTASPGEADIVAQGPSNSLIYYSATPGTAFASSTIAGASTTYSAPSISVGSSGLAVVAAQGINYSLTSYSATPGKSWISHTIASTGTSFAQPAVIVRSTNEADVVAQGTSETLQYYFSSTSNTTSWTKQSVGTL